MDYTSLVRLLNITPGDRVSFLGLTWAFLHPSENLEKDILFTDLNLCDGKLNSEYIRKAYQRSEFKIIVYCQRDEEVMVRPPKGVLPFMTWAKLPLQPYRHRGLKGVIGIIFAKKYLDGIYINVTCANTYDSNQNVIPTKIGLILRTAMLNFSRNHLGFQNAYNHAGNQDLVLYYKRLGWVLSNQICGVIDDISLKFNELSNPEDIKALLNSDFVKNTLLTNSGYPMRLCNYDLDMINKKTMEEFAKVKVEDIIVKYGSLCLPKKPFSNSLKNVYDEANNEYDESYDILNQEGRV